MEDTPQAVDGESALRKSIDTLYAQLLAQGKTGRKARRAIQAELRKASRKAIKAKTQGGKP